MILATPLAVGAPYELSLSPWPSEKGWVTPIDWTINQVLATRPHPGKPSAALSGSISTVIGEALKPTSQTVLGITKVDSVWLFSEFYSSGASGWTSDADATIYKSISEIAGAIQAAVQNPKCARNFDLMEDTRSANTQRVADYESAKKANPSLTVPTPPHPSGP